MAFDDYNGFDDFAEYCLSGGYDPLTGEKLDDDAEDDWFGDDEEDDDPFDDDEEDDDPFGDDEEDDDPFGDDEEDDDPFDDDDEDDGPSRADAVPGPESGSPADDKTKGAASGAVGCVIVLLIALAGAEWIIRELIGLFK